MNYTLNQLRIFLSVVETSSITKAAVELNLSQPAVSIQLRNFQDQFEIPLTEVIGRKLHVTQFGFDVAQSARRILQEVDQIQYKSSAFKGLMTGKLRLSVVSTGKYVMPFFLSSFLRKYPEVSLVMDVTNKQRVINALETNEYDLCMVSIIPEKLSVGRLDLLPNKVYLVAPKHAPDTFKELLDGPLPYIYREEGSGTRQVMEGFLTRYEITPDRTIVLSTNEAVKQAVVAGIGYSLMPIIGIRNQLVNEELKIIPVRGLPIETTWSLIWPSAKQHSPVAQALLNHINAEKEHIIKENFGWYQSF
jgi:DNA-binding transcriptional LysR family regulator